MQINFLLCIFVICRLCQVLNRKPLISISICSSHLFIDIVGCVCVCLMKRLGSLPKIEFVPPFTTIPPKWAINSLVLSKIITNHWLLSSSQHVQVDEDKIHRPQCQAYSHSLLSYSCPTPSHFPLEKKCYIKEISIQYSSVPNLISALLFDKQFHVQILLEWLTLKSQVICIYHRRNKKE